jgi:predicted permease
MKLDFFTVLINIGILLLLGLPGYIFRKNGMLKGGDSKPLVILLIYITQSFMIIMSFQDKEYEPSILSSIGWMALFSALAHIIMIAIAWLIFSFEKDRKARGVYTFASAFANCGYMGLPVISALFYGSPILPELRIYVSFYIAVFNIANWTIGIYIISGDRKYMSIKNALINPTTVALAVALPLFFLKVRIADHLPQLARAFSMLGDMTTPLSMIILGIKLAEMPFRDIFSSWKVYLVSFLKLIAMPLLMMALILPAGPLLGDVARYAIVIIAAMPVATLTIANTERFGGDSLAAAKCLLGSTPLSALTIPLVCQLL